MPVTGDPSTDKITRADLDNLIVDAQRLGQPDTKYAQTIFKRGVLGSAQTIVDLALAGTSERIRFQAAVYVVERVLGRVQDNPPRNDDAPFDNLMAECVSSMPDEEFARLRNAVEQGE
jgi:hypothetical protein